MTNWFENGKVDIILGLQWGSEGKGQIAGNIARKGRYDTLISCSGANSGHTWRGHLEPGYGETKLVHRHLPLGIVSKYTKRVLIGPGAIVNPDILIAELETAFDEVPWAENIDVKVHEYATIIYPRHIEEEGGTGLAIGSTMKGNGAAVREKILRKTHGPNIAGDCDALINHPHIAVVDGREYWAEIMMSNRILYEGAQGCGLSMNSGHYPFTTSRECTPAQMCSDAIIPPQMVRRVIGVARTRPIRVANRYDQDGEMVGWSGPHFPDQEEMNWSDIGVDPELTTVTKLPRRVFSFSMMQMYHSMMLCRPDYVALTFCDYISNAERGAIEKAIEGFGDEIGSPCVVNINTAGPLESDMDLLIARKRIGALPEWEG